MLYFIISCKASIKIIILYQLGFLLTLKSINQAISKTFVVHNIKLFGLFFIFFMFSIKTGSVRSLLLEIKLVWPYYKAIPINCFVSHCLTDPLFFKVPFKENITDPYFWKFQ